MTESTGTPWSGTQTDTEASTRDVAKDEAKGVAQDAAQAGKQTVATAKEQAGHVAGEAATQAKALVDQARDQITSQGTAQKERAATGLRSLADQLGGMAEGSGQQPQGLAGDLVREAQQRVQMVADWLESSEPADVLEDVRRFARRRPGVFLLSAAALGFVGGRVTRSIAAEARDDSGSRSTGYSGGYAGQHSAGYSTGYTTGTPSAGLGGGYTETGLGDVTASTTGTGYGDAGLDDTGLGGTGVPATTEFADTAPGTPGYAIPPTGDAAGDATAQFAPNAPDTGLGEASTDQMPSEFGARGTGAAGNRREEGNL